MEQILLNGELLVSFPESFHVMDVDEVKKAFPDSNPNRLALWDTENHMIVAVLWNVSNKLLAGLASTEALAKRVEKVTEKNYAHAGYRYGGATSSTVCGEKAAGFRYAYTLSGVEQSGEVVLFKHGATCYTIYCYERTELADTTHALFEGIVSALTIR